MKKQNVFSKDYIWLSIFMLLSVVMILTVSSQKINYHIDELLTYNLANSENFEVAYTETYSSFGEYQTSYLTPGEEDAFNYNMVWKNQAGDVHPPLYYSVIHTLSSVSPDAFSKYIGIGINIFFHLLIILLLYRLSLLLTRSRELSLIISGFWALNPGVVSDTTFIRMYMMTMFFCLFITYVHMKFLKDKEFRNYKFYLSIFAISVAGALTHYYFLVFTFFLSGIFALYLLYRKYWKSFSLYVVSYLAVLGTVYLLFRSSVDHLFGEGRGEESLDNLSTLQGYVSTLVSFVKIVNGNLFGGAILYIAVAILLACAVYVFKTKRIPGLSPDSGYNRHLLLLCGISLFYFILVSNIAVYTTERYVQPIFPIMILLFVIFVQRTFHLFVSYHAALISTVAVCVLLSINGYVNTTSFDYLKSNSEEALEVSRQYSDTPVLFLYNRDWKIWGSYAELKNYSSEITFYRPADMEVLQEETEYDEFILYTQLNDEQVLSEISEEIPGIEGYEKLAAYGYTDVYLFK